MSHREQTDKISKVAVRKLTKTLSLSPTPGQTQPSEEWLSQQKQAVKALPQSCLRPPPNDPYLLLLRGVIKATEAFSDVPFVPDAAVLCKAHKNLHPWRMRSLFLLLASEVGIKSDRIRRHKGIQDQLPADCVLEFVRRMTSVAGMWMEPEDFNKRFGFEPQDFCFMQSSCEACMLAVVGARAQILVDLRANILARQKIGGNYQPALLRFVDSWIHHFDAHAGYLMMESDRLAHELRAVRDAELEKRRERNARHRKRTGRDQKLPRRVMELNSDGYPLPRPLIQSTSTRGSEGVRGLGLTDRPMSWHVFPNQETSTAQPSDAAMSGGQDGFDSVGGIDAWRRGVRPMSVAAAAEVCPPLDSPALDRDVDFDNQLDGHEEEQNDWADEVGSYYFNNDNNSERGNSKDDAHVGEESDQNPGVRSNWKNPWTSVKANGRIHPAMKSQVAVMDRISEHGDSTPAGASDAGASDKPLTAQQKLHNLWRHSSSASRTSTGPSRPSRKSLATAQSPTESTPSNHPRPGRPASITSASGGHGLLQLYDEPTRDTDSPVSLLGMGPMLRNEAPSDRTSRWTEGTLHSLGGRTDLGLAPPPLPNDFLANLVRDELGLLSNPPTETNRALVAPTTNEEALRLLEGRSPVSRPRPDLDRRGSRDIRVRRPSWTSSVCSNTPPTPTLATARQGGSRSRRESQDTLMGMFMMHHDETRDLPPRAPLADSGVARERKKKKKLVDLFSK